MSIEFNANWHWNETRFQKTTDVRAAAFHRPLTMLFPWEGHERETRMQKAISKAILSDRRCPAVETRQYFLLANITGGFIAVHHIAVHDMQRHRRCRR
jgi:hypothetical protein